MLGGLIPKDLQAQLGAGLDELRDQMAGVRQCLNTIIRQNGREYLLADSEQVPPSPHDAPVLIQHAGTAAGGLGRYQLRERLPGNRYAMRGYVANQDTNPLWVQVIVPNGQTTAPFLVPAGVTWPFPCNVADVLIVTNPDDGTAACEAWQIMAQ